VSLATVVVRARSGGPALDELLAALARQTAKAGVLRARADEPLDAIFERIETPLVALVEEGAVPADDGWLAALLAPLGDDAEAGAVAGVLVPGPPVEARRFQLGDGPGADRLPLACAAVRRDAWDEVRFGDSDGDAFARALLGAGWAKVDAPAARALWSGPQSLPPPRSTPPQPRRPDLLTRLAGLARTTARAAEVLRDGGPAAVLQRLRERAEEEPAGPWYQRHPWPLIAEPRPPPPPPRPAPQGPWTVNWVVPAFFAGSGGHMNIFRAVRQLEERGHRCRVLFTSTEGLLPPEGVRIRALVHEHFQPIRARCLAWRGAPLPQADVHVATHWDTAYVVDRRRRSGLGAYCVQDWEPSFYPVGAQAALADATYDLGLFHLTLGPWLAARLHARGAAAAPFDQAVDRSEYYVEDGLRPPEGGRVAVYLRPLTPRRGFEIVCLALRELKRRRPGVEIAAYGAAPADLELPFEARRLGVLTAGEMRRLYCTSTVGLSFSLTNASIVPPEMMACGLPVVEADVESVRALYRDGADALLAPPEPLGLAARLEAALDDVALRARLRETGLARAAGLTWERSGAQIESALRSALEKACTS